MFGAKRQPSGSILNKLFRKFRDFQKKTIDGVLSSKGEGLWTTTLLTERQKGLLHISTSGDAFSVMYCEQTLTTLIVPTPENIPIKINVSSRM